MEFFKIIAVIIIALGIHYLLWLKAYRIWFGHFKGLVRILSLVVLGIIEAVVAVIVLMV